jgi:uncharacterized protein
MSLAPSDLPERRMRFWSACGTFITTRPGLVLVVAAGFALVGAINVRGLQPSSTLDAMLVMGNPASDAMVRIMSDYHGMDELLVIVSVPDEEASADTAEQLLLFAKRFAAAFRDSTELSELCRNVLFAESPDMATFVEKEIIPSGLYYVDDRTLTEIRERLTPQSMRKQIGRAIDSLSAPGIGGGSLGRLAARDPLGLRDFLPALASQELSPADDAFFSRDRRSLLIRLLGLRPVSDLDYARTLTESARRTAARINTYGFHVEFTGGYAIATTSERAIRADMIFSITCSLIILQLLFWLIYRHPLCFPVVVAPVALGILTGFAIYALFSTHLAPLTAVTGAVLAGLGIDYSIHYLSHYESRRADGSDEKTAARQALIDIGPALTNACGTSLIGFLAITQSKVAALREFALVGAMGLAGALIATLLVLPAMLILIHRWIGGRLNLSGVRIQLGGSSAMTRARPAAWQAGALILMAGAIVVAGTSSEGALRFEADLTVMHPRPNPALEAQSRVVRQFGHSFDPLLILLRDSSPEGLVDLAHEVGRRLTGENSAKRTEHRALDTGNVTTFGIAHLLPDPGLVAERRSILEEWNTGEILAAFDNAIADSPFAKEAFADYRAFLEQLLNPGPPPDWSTLLKYPAITRRMLPQSALEHEPDGQYEALTVLMLREPPANRTARNALIEALRSALSDLPGATLTGMSVIGYETERQVRHDIGLLLGVSAMIVIAWLLFLFRNVRDTLLALTPMLFSFSILVGLMAVMDWRINAINLIAVPLLVGLGVDNGIILVTVVRHNRRSKATSSPFDILAPTCHALTMTAATTFLAFGTLIWTSTPAISSFGMLMGAGIAATLAGSLFLLVPTLARRS